MSTTDPSTTIRAARRSDALSLAIVGLHYMVVFTPIYIAASLGPGWNTVLTWIWFGALSHGALLVLHEAAHKLLFTSTAWNEGLARWLIGPLFLADFTAFRKRHWAHHRELGQAGDPKYTYRIDIAGWRLAWLVLSTLALWQAVRRLFYQTGANSQSTEESTRQTVLSIAVVQAALLLSITFVARSSHQHSWIDTGIAAATAYLFVYLYGLASLGVLMHALRGIIEHRPCEPGEPRTHEAAVRNFSDGFLTRWAFAPYGFVEHATHHQHPALPYYALPGLTEHLARESPDLDPVGSHWRILAKLARGSR